MANAFYENFRAGLLNQAPVHGVIDLDDAATNIQIMLIDTATETFAPGDQDHADITTPVATSGNVASKAVGTTAAPINGLVGNFDHADMTPAFTAVSGLQSEALVYMKWTGTSSTSPLICWIDTGQTGLPVTPNGGDINWAPHASGVFQIT